MKVHLVKSKEVDTEKFTAVVELLRAVAGPMEFCCNENDIIHFEEDELFSNVISKKERFEKQERHVYVLAQMREESRKMNFPMERKEVSWDTIFSKCRQYRKKNKIQHDEFVVLLTDIANHKNWFACLDEENPYNGFIHTYDWDYFLDCNDWEVFHQLGV